MSSSRIIKSGRQQDVAIAEINFAAIGSMIPPDDGAPAEGFVPMGLFDLSDVAEAGAEEHDEEIDQGPPRIELTEDELARQTSDAFNAGLKEGKELAERGLVNVFHALRTASEQIRNLRERVLRESEDELINLVMMVARKVISRELAQDSGILALLIQNALADLSKREEITVRLNPQDHAVLLGKHGQTLERELQFERLQIKADATVASGGCEIDTELGTIDASIDAQLEEIYRHLLEQKSAASADEQA